MNVLQKLLSLFGLNMSVDSILVDFHEKVKHLQNLQSQKSALIAHNEKIVEQLNDQNEGHREEHARAGKVIDKLIDILQVE